MKEWIIQIAGAVVIVAIGALIGTSFTPGPWYTELEKPFFTPPSWLFSPVWITLYALMGIAAYLVWRQGTDRGRVRFALTVFFVHLAVNTAWSLVFFGLEAPLGGLVVILVLLALIGWLIVLFGRITRTAAWLLVPYLLWVTYATALNAAIWWMN